MDRQGQDWDGDGGGTDAEKKRERWPKCPREHITKMADLYRDQKLGGKGSVRFEVGGGARRTGRSQGTEQDLSRVSLEPDTIECWIKSMGHQAQ